MNPYPTWISIDGTEVIADTALTNALNTGMALIIERTPTRLHILWNPNSPRHAQAVMYQRQPDPTDCPTCGTTKVDRLTDGSCPTCRFWTYQFGTPGGLIINGEHYRVDDEPTPEELDNYPYLYGSYGHRFVIRHVDGTEIVTHNLWHQGTIPPGLTRPDNAAFVNDNPAGAR